MGFLNRKPRDESLPGTRNNHSHRHEKRNPNVLRMATRPSFGQWLKVTWLDILTMIILGAIGLGVYEAHPAPSRSFPVYFSDGEIVYSQFAYPLRNEIIPIWAAALLGSLVPISVFLICQIRIRSFWDINNAVIGLLYSLITAAVFQVFLKWLIGGLRPHFLTVCQPDLARMAAQTGNGLSGIMYDRTICTGDQDQIDDSLESFPSGHSTAAFAGFVFLSLYLNAKLKVWSNYHPAMWKLIAVYAPILGATLIAGALTIDEYHNWYDCLAGAVIGTVMAFSAYRMVYASIWDWRTNHIPLNRGIPFNGSGADGEYAVWTRKVGWGVGEPKRGRDGEEFADRTSSGYQTGRMGHGTRSASMQRGSVGQRPSMGGTTTGGGVVGDGYDSSGSKRHSLPRKPVAAGSFHHARSGSDDMV